MESPVISKGRRNNSPLLADISANSDFYGHRHKSSSILVITTQFRQVLENCKNESYFFADSCRHVRENRCLLFDAFPNVQCLNIKVRTVDPSVLGRIVDI